MDNIVYGLDPHDGSRRLGIAGNTAIGTRRTHGIIVSRGVSDSWILENRAIDNAGTGIVIDAASSDNVVARNLAAANRGDGFSLFESPHRQSRDRQSQEWAPDPQRLGARGPRPMYPWLICGPNGRLIGDHQLGHATPASRARAPVAADRRR